MNLRERSPQTGKEHTGCSAAVVMSDLADCCRRDSWRYNITFQHGAIGFDLEQVDDKQHQQIVFIYFNYWRQLVEGLRYEPQGRRFDSRWGHSNFSLT